MRNREMLLRRLDALEMDPDVRELLLQRCATAAREAEAEGLSREDVEQRVAAALERDIVKIVLGGEG